MRHHNPPPFPSVFLPLTLPDVAAAPLTHISVYPKASALFLLQASESLLTKARSIFPEPRSVLGTIDLGSVQIVLLIEM